MSRRWSVQEIVAPLEGAPCHSPRASPESSYNTAMANGTGKARMAGMNAADREIARELRQRLAQGVKIEDFRVFGSRVRGEATPESDLDVYLVVTELTPALRRWIDEIAWEVGFDKDRVISTLVTTRRGLEQGPFGAQPVVQTIEREGISI